MKNLHGFLYSRRKIMFHGLLEFALGPPPRGRCDAKYGIPCQINNWFGLWRTVEGPLDYMVAALGSCVK
jgi:hypothetical protein